MSEAAELSDRYRLIRPLGFGGMSEIYLVEDLELREHKALKILRTELAQTAHFASRFRREARAIRRLDHPNIVAASDFGQLPDGRFFLALDHVPGVELGAIMRDEVRLRPARCIEFLLQLADAIDHAHSRGVVHRDLKPANILVVRDGAKELIRVVDFGIAKIVAHDYDDSVGSTRDGERWGSPIYMAPELITGAADDPRIDIYAAGCLAYEMLTGRPPFVGSVVEVCSAHVDRAPLPPSVELPPNMISPAFDAVVQRCMEKLPESRYASGAELRRALEALPDADDARGARSPHTL